MTKEMTSRINRGLLESLDVFASMDWHSTFVVPQRDISAITQLLF